MILQRESETAWCTYGTMQNDAGETECQTIEKKWADNQPDASCIPAGEYQCSLRFSPHHGFSVYGVDQVAGRSDIEIHAANLASQLLGCIALGESRGQINGQDAVFASQSAVDVFMAARGCASYRELTTEALTDAWIAENQDASTFQLSVRAA